MKHFKGDLVKAFAEQKVDFMVHQVNCAGVMGSGIALQIKNACPQHFEDYQNVCNNIPEGKTPLGQSVGTFVKDAEDRISGFIIGLFGQQAYGNDERQTNYFAFASALHHFLTRYADICNQCESVLTIGMPKLIGCDRAGGDWEIISKILEDAEKQIGIEFHIYEFAG